MTTGQERRSRLMPTRLFTSSAPKYERIVEISSSSRSRFRLTSRDVDWWSMSDEVLLTREIDF